MVSDRKPSGWHRLSMARPFASILTHDRKSGICVLASAFQCSRWVACASSLRVAAWAAHGSLAASMRHLDGTRQEGTAAGPPSCW